MLNKMNEILSCQEKYTVQKGMTDIDVSQL